MEKPLTLNFAQERLSAALDAGNTPEIEKWAMIIAYERAWQAKMKQRHRVMDEFARESALRELYRRV